MSLTATMTLALLSGQAQLTPPSNIWDILEPERVCDVSQTWIIGVGSPRASTTHSHVDRLTVDGQAVIQAVHRSTDPLDATHDLFVVANTLHPLSTRHTGPDPDVAFAFDAEGASKLSESGEVVERTPLPEPAMAEGPGLEIIVQAVPWREGLVFSGWMLDRWRGEGAGRAKPFVWRVTGTETLTTGDGAAAAYRTVLAPDDGSFEIVGFVSLERPHRILRFEYRRTSASEPLISETRRYAAWCGTL
jgi:hypothetical protein